MFSSGYRFLLVCMLLRGPGDVAGMSRWDAASAMPELDATLPSEIVHGKSRCTLSFLSFSPRSTSSSEQREGVHRCHDCPHRSCHTAACSNQTVHVALTGKALGGTNTVIYVQEHHQEVFVLGE